MLRPFAAPPSTHRRDACHLPRVGLLSERATERGQVVPIRTGPLNLFAPPALASRPRDSTPARGSGGVRGMLLARLDAYEAAHAAK